MRIAALYSHLNGLEFLKVKQPKRWKEIQKAIKGVDASACRTKVSKERRMKGRILYSPEKMNAALGAAFIARDWKQSRVSYYVTGDENVIRKTMEMDKNQQRSAIVAAGFVPIYSFNQTDFVKDRVAVEVQFGKYSFVAYDLFVKHLAFYARDVIDVGVEIVAMKELKNEMSSGPGYYEGELYNLLRQGRGVPGVPLVLIGVAP